MVKTPTLNLIDITVREGGSRVQNRLFPEQVASIARELQKSGLAYAEISHGNGIGAFKSGYPALFPDKDLLLAARESAPRLKFSVFIHPSLHSLPELDSLEDYFELGRVSLNPNEPDKGQNHFKKLKSASKTALAQLNRVHLFSPRQIAEAAKKIEELGADVIYLMDNFGSLEPSQVRAYIESVRGKTSLPVGFCGRNNTGQAVANSLAAIRAGAEWIDGSLLGLGAGAGVTPWEILVSLLQAENILPDLDLANLSFAAYHCALPVLRSLPLVTYLDLLYAKHKVDYYPQEFILNLAQVLEISPEAFIQGLKEKNPGLIQLKEATLRQFLEGERLDFDVVMEYIKTGHIPSP